MKSWSRAHNDYFVKPSMTSLQARLSKVVVCREGERSTSGPRPVSILILPTLGLPGQGILIGRELIASRRDDLVYSRCGGTSGDQAKQPGELMRCQSSDQGEDIVGFHSSGQ